MCDGEPFLLRHSVRRFKFHNFSQRPLVAFTTRPANEMRTKLRLLHACNVVLQLKNYVKAIDDTKKRETIKNKAGGIAKKNILVGQHSNGQDDQ